MIGEGDAPMPAAGGGDGARWLVGVWAPLVAGGEVADGVAGAGVPAAR